MSLQDDIDIRNAKMELASFKKKYSNLKELSAVIKAIDVVLEES